MLQSPLLELVEVGELAQQASHTLIMSNLQPVQFTTPCWQAAKDMSAVGSTAQRLNEC